ncbi:MAG: S-methyl-5-thioribose-1-phosphate isomerase [Nocardioidaceae bacterium]
MLPPLRYEDGALLVLDQRRLPAEESWLRCESAEQVAEAIRTLAVRGAPAIGLAAAYGLALGMREPGADLDAVAALLLATRPTAVNLRWALERGRAAWRAALDAGDARPADALLELARGLERDQLGADRRLSELGAARLPDAARVLTHCNTGPLATGGYGTAVGVLRAAHAGGRLRQAWVSETRPLLQGARLTAWELAREGIPFRVVTDASAGALMARGAVDAVVVGADRVARNGDVANKIGTYPLAVLAHRHGLPFYVAAPVSTLDPDTESGAQIPIEERDACEVLELLGRRLAPEGAAAYNAAFDVTPAELVSAVFTEAGVLEPPYERAITGAVRG